jgi:hypothetical protein
VHRTRILGRWLPELLAALWREWHPGAVEQLRLPLEMSAGVLAGAGWQIFSDYPACIVAEPSPEDEPDRCGKYSRIFLPDSAQWTFDWFRETAAGGQEGARVG